MAKSKDLFDDSTMSFGEHLEVLRIHLWRALIGLFICVMIALIFGDRMVGIIREPIDEALQAHGQIDPKDSTENGSAAEQAAANGDGGNADGGEPDQPVQYGPDTIVVDVDTADLVRALIQSDIIPPDQLKTASGNVPEATDPGDGAGKSANQAATGNSNATNNSRKTVRLPISSPAFAQLQGQLDEVVDRQSQAVTLTVTEAFVTWLKVSFVTGFVIASPWVFYQLWLFVAAGLYPHERHYVYVYLPMSITLFITGVVFCFYAVFPFVLKFLLGFNKTLQVFPQIRLSEWISFALTLPLMFGLSFQLPLVMLFLERISIFEVEDYRQRRRMAILVIAILSMFMTPADPMSMVLMMCPLLALYELGILLCGMRLSKSPYETEAA